MNKIKLLAVSSVVIGLVIGILGLTIMPEVVAYTIGGLSFLGLGILCTVSGAISFIEEKKK